MTQRSFQIVLLIAAVTVGCAQSKADNESLRASFSDQISESSFVSDFTREGDELSFLGPDRDGGSVEWRVRIDTSLVEPNLFDEAMPYVGRITSEWTADGEIVGFLGNMTALSQEFLDRGLGQECWAYWVEAENRWDW